jgi:methylenetetrahydrofolate dehydrogenase (NADP+) / methenyltetrahydrofolate cyclohydrolase
MILDGKKIAQKLRDKISEEIAENNYKITLAFILVGDHPPSKSYVSMKKKACLEVGITSKIISLEEPSEKELLDLIDSLNKDKNIHGILLQQPLPPYLLDEHFLEVIDAAKDVDGFHPINQGKVILSDPTGFTPCTPLGIIEILKDAKITTSGKHIVILGRSNIVSKPLANLLLQKGDYGDATVTVAHSKTKNLEEITKQADILIAAVGRDHFVSKEMIKDGAVVIDVGINRIASNKIVGDVDFQAVQDRASSITPVPGGVGPMTIASLLANTLKAFKISKL